MTKMEIAQVASTSILCFLLICLRGIYRLTKQCHNHAHIRCHRKWHVDDLWVGFGMVPLLGRALCIAWSNALLDESVDPMRSKVERRDAKILSAKLVLPSRVFYVLFLWCMKMCLLELYMRLSGGIRGYRIAGLVIKCSLYLTYIAVVLATLLECRPLQLVWNGDPTGAKCRKARANLITMAVCNISTDMALIIFPMVLLRHSGLDFVRGLRLIILFALGSLVIVTTLIRLPLIIRDNAQKTRTLWASVEIVCACIVANAAFFQAVFLDLKGAGKHGAMPTMDSSLDSRRPSRRTNPDDEEMFGNWKITTLEVNDRTECDITETSSPTSRSESSSTGDQRLYT